MSEERAKTVLTELTASGIDPSRLKSVGYGAQKPLAPNDSEENRAKTGG
ncbi:OmpA family protein [Spirosoma oryzicola]|nr:OmpA family protein [Spirosoma oryzicola]UHG94352.1 OmpA family protein [Spirosoma oryzicola]